MKKNLANKTKEELFAIREELVCKYIGTLDKPVDYFLTLKILDRLISSKG